MENKYCSVYEQGRQFVKRYHPTFVSEYMFRNCSKDVCDLIEQADEIKEQKFRFKDKWDMEPCGELYCLDPMVWDESPNGDPEWVYMLNRHDYLYKLLLAYYLTKDMEYIKSLKWYLFHWIEHNEILPHGSETTRTIDTGIRCMNWQILLLHLTGQNLLSEEETGEIIGSLFDQYESMRARYIEKYTLSNWGVLQITAICMGYLLFEEYLPEGDMKEWAWKELETQFSLQVLDEGAHWEQSLMYHMEVLICCMKLLTICQYKGKDVEWLSQKIETMSSYVMYAAAPDHHQIAQCDSDVTDVRDILTKAAVLTGNPEFRYAGYKCIDLDSAWLLGKNGIIKYDSIKEKEPTKKCLFGMDSGNVFFRSDWSEGTNYTYLTCGNLGSGHGHADLTHISLYYQGKPFLIDSGRYSYREEEPLRVLLKKAQAHNVCVVDGISMGIPNGSWSYYSYPDCMKTYYCEKQGIHFVEMSYRIRLLGKQYCHVIRKVMAADVGIWFIVDDINCDGIHSVEEYYHLDPKVKVSVTERSCPATTLNNSGSEINITGLILPQIESCKVSMKYNEIQDSLCLIKRSDFEDRFIDWTSISGKSIREEDVSVYQYGKKEPVDSSVVSARKYVLSEDESWIFLIWNTETFQGGKLYMCEEVPIYAKAAAIHIINGKTMFIRLKN